MEKVNAASVPRAERILRRVNCLPTDLVGMCVRITGPKVGLRYQVTAVDVTSPVHAPAVGILIDKTSATEGLVQFHGPMRQVYAGLTSGATYYVGTDALLARPGDGNYPADGDWFQRVGVAIDAPELLLDFGEPTQGAPAGLARRYRRTLSGALNGINATFMAERTFIASGALREQVFRNGVMQEAGAMSDYIVSESVPSAGYDTVVFAVPPMSWEKLYIDFTPDIDL